MSKVNRRILVSRNKREGQYAGRCSKRFNKGKSIRIGGQSIYAVKLKGPSLGWVCTILIHRGF